MIFAITGRLVCLSLVDFVSAVLVSEGPFVNLPCKSGLEAEFSVSTCCFSPPSSACVVALSVLELRAGRRVGQKALVPQFGRAVPSY